MPALAALAILTAVGVGLVAVEVRLYRTDRLALREAALTEHESAG